MKALLSLPARFTALLAAALCLWLVADPASAQSARSAADWMQTAASARAAGRPMQAIGILGSLVAAHPDNRTVGAALEAALADLGSVRRAEARLRTAITRDPTHREAWLAALAALDAHQPLRLSADVALQPTTNLGHVSSERYLVTDLGTFVIEDGGDEEPGVGLSFGIKGDLVQSLAPGRRLHLDFGLRGGWFEEARLRYVEPSLGLRYEDLTGDHPWQAETYLRHRVYDGDPGEVTSDVFIRGVAVTKRWNQAGRAALTLGLRGEYRDYAEKPYFSGPFYALNLSRSQPLGDKARLSYGARIERSRTRTDYHRYTGAGLSVGIDRALGPKLVGGISLAADLRRYDADFPILATPREDRSLTLGVSAQLTGVEVFGAVPKLSCSARRNRSNVALYSYESLDCGLGWDLRF